MTGVLARWHYRWITAASHSHSHIGHGWRHGTGVCTGRTRRATWCCRRGWWWWWRKRGRSTEGNRGCGWRARVKTCWCWLTAVHLLLVHRWSHLLVHWRGKWLLVSLWSKLLIHLWPFWSLWGELLIHLLPFWSSYEVCYRLFRLLGLSLLLVLLFRSAFAGVWCC